MATRATQTTSTTRLGALWPCPGRTSCSAFRSRRCVCSSCTRATRRRARLCSRRGALPSPRRATSLRARGRPWATTPTRAIRTTARALSRGIKRAARCTLTEASRPPRAPCSGGARTKASSRSTTSSRSRPRTRVSHARTARPRGTPQTSTRRRRL
eukprot:Amastigsp_a485_50.p4 type:complete len:156 gc:universal Amastigsp_a485_50:716-1183(+)